MQLETDNHLCMCTKILGWAFLKMVKMRGMFEVICWLLENCRRSGKESEIIGWDDIGPGGFSSFFFSSRFLLSRYPTLNYSGTLHNFQCGYSPPPPQPRLKISSQVVANFLRLFEYGMGAPSNAKKSTFKVKETRTLCNV